MDATEPLRAARAALAPLPAAYTTLFDRVVGATSGDERIRALWLGGSIARGDADAGSDLDLLLTVSNDAVSWFEVNWRDWIGSITPLLLASPLPEHPGSFFATTEECLRIDVIVERASAVASTPYRTRLAVLDRDGLAQCLPEPVAAVGPQPAAVAAVIEEFYRQQVIFPAAVVVRADWLLGVVGVHQTQLLLYQLFGEVNAPQPPMGVKQWSRRLSGAQRQILAELPSPQANAASVVEAMQAVRRAFRTAGRDAVRALGFEWPEHVDEVVDRCWKSAGL